MSQGRRMQIIGLLGLALWVFYLATVSVTTTKLQIADRKFAKGVTIWGR